MGRIVIDDTGSVMEESLDYLEELSLKNIFKDLFIKNKNDLSKILKSSKQSLNFFIFSVLSLSQLFGIHPKNTCWYGRNIKDVNLVFKKSIIIDFSNFFNSQNIRQELLTIVKKKN